MVSQEISKEPVQGNGIVIPSGGVDPGVALDETIRGNLAGALTASAIGILKKWNTANETDKSTVESALKKSLALPEGTKIAIVLDHEDAQHFVFKINGNNGKTLVQFAVPLYASQVSPEGLKNVHYVVLVQNLKENGSGLCAPAGEVCSSGIIDMRGYQP